MVAEHLKDSVSQNMDDDNIELDWLKWCRLCSKQDLSEQESSSIFSPNEAGKLSSDLATSIGKYFWVNIKADDEISQCVCLECKQLIEELVAFTEHVNKVQIYFCLLQNIRPTTLDQAYKLRSQSGLINDRWQHIIKLTPEKVQEPLKPLLIDKEIQTDLITSTQNEKDESYITQTCSETEEIIDILRKPDKNEYENQTEADTDNVYQYVVNGDNGVEYIEPSVSVDNEDVTQAIPEATQDDVQDSDLFKELKYKICDDDDIENDNDGANNDEQTTGFKIISEQEELEVEYQDSSHTSHQEYEEEEDMEHSVEMLEEEGDGQEYVTIGESQNEKKNDAFELLKGKRGRPFGSKNLKTDASTYHFDCKVCKRRYKNPNIFRKHMSSAHNIVVDDLPDFKSKCNTCSVCNKQFLTRSSLKLHMRHHLPDEEKYNVPCPYCDRKFSQVGAMRQHVNGIHHQMKPFICDQCGRACKTMAALTEHQLVHTNECPFECEVCHKRFKNKPRLKSHLDTHNKSLYKCPDCGLELNTRRTLLQHRLVHSDVKRFKCEFCDAAFKRSKALKNHLILHSGLRPYKCNFCNKSFSNGSNCRAHKKRAHPRELAEEEANGIEPERVPIPKLEELKSAKGVLVQPRKIKRNVGGLPNQLRKLLESADKSKQENTNNYEDAAENYESYAEFQYEMCKSEIDETESLVDNPSEECEETVIYEIIDEI